MTRQLLFRAKLFGALAAIVALGGCSSAPRLPPAKPMAAAPMNTALIAAKRLWTRKVAGLLTDLDISDDGSTVLVATVPDHDSLDPKANHSEHYVTFYSRSGKVVSRTAMPAQVKSQALSADGSFAVIATYDDMLRGLSRDGKKLWATEASCRPILLGKPHSPERARRILCFNDDDARPNLSFEVFSWNGKRLSEFTIHEDALALKVAPDGKSFILALTHGKVIVFNSAFKPIERRRVSGEIVDVAISNLMKKAPQKPSFVVLSDVKGHAQKLSYFPARGVFRGARGIVSIPIAEHAEDIAIAPGGGAVFGYSNTDDGQVLARFSKRPGEVWRRRDAKTAEYTSRLIATRKRVWVGFQDAHVLSYDPAGGLQADIHAPGEEGAFLYTFAVSPSARFIAVGMDDGSLSLFRVE